MTPITSCVLCAQRFETAELQRLGGEIQGLIEEFHFLTVSLQAACSQIIERTNTAVEKHLKMETTEALEFDPLKTIEVELRNLLIDFHNFTKTLPAFGTLFDQFISEADHAGSPVERAQKRSFATQFESQDSKIIDEVLSAIQGVDQAVKIVSWSEQGTRWITGLYNDLLGSPTKADEGPNTKQLRGLADYLLVAANRAKPARSAAKELQSAAKESDTWLKDEETRKRRTTISDAIEPLKLLPNYVESVVSQQLETLSDRIASIAEMFHISTRLEFERAHLEREAKKRKGFVRARASFKSHDSSSSSSSQYEFDASGVSNTSWMRALLWAFLFALRESRAGSGKTLPLPLMVMDDPQTTFDFEHRCQWIDAVLGSDSSKCLIPPAQAVITTCEKSFAHQITLQSDLTLIREIAAPLTNQDSIFVNGTQYVDTIWKDAERTKANHELSASIGALRKFLEQLVRSIFPSALGANESTLGKLMTELKGRADKKHFPYDCKEIAKMIAAWEEPAKNAQRKALSEVHHTDSDPYDYHFAKGVFAWYRGGLHSQFQAAFRRILDIREAGWRIPHSGLAKTSAIKFVSGTDTTLKVPANLNKVIGRVAAETGGRQTQDFEEQQLHYVAEDFQLEELGDIEAYILSAATLEPVAQIGDVLLVSSTAPVTENCLVVVYADGAMRARRYGILGSSAFNAVLSANSVNPREIRRPILVESNGANYKKVIGIIYRCGWGVPASADDEVAAIHDMGKLSSSLGQSPGIARAFGESAEPIALDGQFLILGPNIPGKNELSEYDGHPVVVEEHNWTLFKRLRLAAGGLIVLESLNTAGRHSPITISATEATKWANHSGSSCDWRIV